MAAANGSYGTVTTVEWASLVISASDRSYVVRLLEYYRTRGPSIVQGGVQPYIQYSSTVRAVRAQAEAMCRAMRIPRASMTTRTYAAMMEALARISDQ